MSLTTQDLVALFRKHPIGFGCGLLVVVLGAATYYRFDLLPAAETTLEEKSTEGERLKANLKNAVLLQEQFDALGAANREVGVRAVRVGALATNLQYFYRIEAETGTKLLDLRQLAPAAQKGPQPKYLRVPYSLSVRGEYAKIVEFLRRLEGGQHFCRITGATFSPAPAEAPGEVTMVLSLELLGQP